VTVCDRGGKEIKIHKNVTYLLNGPEFMKLRSGWRRASTSAVEGCQSDAVIKVEVMTCLVDARSKV